MREIYLESVNFTFMGLYGGVLIMLFFFWGRLDQKAFILLYGKQPKSILLKRRKKWASYVVRGTLFLAVFFLMLSLCFPYVVREEKSFEKKGVEGHQLQALKKSQLSKEVIFLVDTSYSMSVKDTRQGVSRLDLAKELIEEVASGLEGEEVALYAFTSELSKVVPITHDYLFFRFMNKELSLNTGEVAGTDFLKAFETLNQSHFYKHPRHARLLILFTDGGDTRLEGVSGEAYQREMQVILSQLQNFERQGIAIFPVGLGSKQGEVIPGMYHEKEPVHSSLDEVFLQKIAEKTAGRYYSAQDLSSLSIANDLLQHIRHLEAKASNKETKMYEQKRALGSIQGYERQTFLYQGCLALGALCLWLVFFMEKKMKVV